MWINVAVAAAAAVFNAHRDYGSDEARGREGWISRNVGRK